MWSQTLTSYLLLVSLLIKDSSAGRYDVRKRELYTVQHDIVITEQVDVVLKADGSTSTAAPYAVETTSILGTPSLVVEAPPPPPNPEVSPAPAPVPAPEDDNDKDDDKDDDSSEEDLDDAIQDPAPAPPQAEPAANVEQPAVAAVAVAPQQQPEQPVAAAALVPAPAPSPQSQDVSQLFSPPSFEPAQAQPNVSNLENSAPSQFVTPNNKGVSPNGGGKRGIAYNDALKLSAFSTSSKVSWAYNWGSTTPVIPHEYEFVPMLWGLGHFTDGWFAAADMALSTGSKHILSFNEPDLGAQASLSVAEAVQGYQKFVQPYAGKARLGSPAVTNGGAPMGLSYLNNFITSCSGCTIDFIAIHWYNGGNAQDFKDYITKAHNVGGGRPVWITEFEASGDQAQQQAFLNDVLPWLDSQDFVERYAYFMASDGNLISSGTSLSSVGQAFAFE